MSQGDHVNIRKSIEFQDKFPNLPSIGNHVVHPHLFSHLFIYSFDNGLC